MRRGTSDGARPRATALETRLATVPRSSLHWLLLTFLLLGVVLWTSIPTFATPGRAPVCVDAEAHASPGQTPEHGPVRPSGERGEVEVIEDERDPESDDDRGLLAEFPAVEISTLALAASRLSRLMRGECSHATPLSGAGCIRGPPSSRVKLLSI